MNTTGHTNNMNLLQQFAVKGSNQKVALNDKVIIYNRCSTEKQDSLEWQEAVCKNYCQQKNLQHVKTFSEKESATTDDRTEFRKMKEFCEKEGISNIVTYSYNRFSRTGDVNLLEDLRNKGIKVHAASQFVDDETASGRFARNMYVMMAKMENEQRRDTIIEGQRNKLRRGEWIGKPTLGYKKEWLNGQPKHDLEKKQCIINEEGEKLRQAFYWKDTENITNVEIIDRLAKMGLHLTPPKLTQIFRNPFYCGYITSTLLDPGEIIRGKHEPLVSEEVFLRVNGIVNNYHHGYTVVRRHNEMPLKASVKCGKCDRPFTAYTRKDGAYIYYKCPNKGCNVNIRNARLHDLFAAELSKLSVQPELVPVIKAQLEATYRMLHAIDVDKEKPMKDELTRLKNELETMELNLATSKITPELFYKFSGAHKQKIKEIEESLQTLSKGSSNLDKWLEKAAKYASNLLTMWKLSDYTIKIRLQKLVFPEGLRYDPEKQAVRTLKINPIFSAISYISNVYEDSKSEPDFQNNEKLRQLYQTFASSNSFLEHLEAINSQMIDYEGIYRQLWGNSLITYYNQASGGTEMSRMRYSSDVTGVVRFSGNTNQESSFLEIGVMNGGTSAQI